jgi:hypothetical protein
MTRMSVSLCPLMGPRCEHLLPYLLLARRTQIVEHLLRRTDCESNTMCFFTRKRVSGVLQIDFPAFGLGFPPDQPGSENIGVQDYSDEGDEDVQEGRSERISRTEGIFDQGCPVRSNAVQDGICTVQSSEIGLVRPVVLCYDGHDGRATKANYMCLSKLIKVFRRELTIAPP